MLRLYWTPLILLTAGLVAGLYSAVRLSENETGLFANHSGHWSHWATKPSRRNNPYSKAHYIGYSRLPPNPFDNLETNTNSDIEGKYLTSNCSYRIIGKPFKTRLWWLLTSARHAKKPYAAISSNDIIMDNDGSFSITLASDPQPGNWVQLQPDQDFELQLNLYGLSNNPQIETTLPELPQIIRMGCK